MEPCAQGSGDFQVFGDRGDELRAPSDCIILDTRRIATGYPGDRTFSYGRQ